MKKQKRNGDVYMKKTIIKFAGQSGRAITFAVTDDHKEFQFVGCHLGEIAVSTQGERMNYMDLAKLSNKLTVCKDEKKVIVETEDTEYHIYPSTAAYEYALQTPNTIHFLGMATMADGYKKEDIKPMEVTFTSTPKKKKSKSKSAINDSELDVMLEKIKENFAAGVKFQNKEIAPHVAHILSARQTPSRLKKLVDAGHLKSDEGKPKSYWY